MFSVLSGSSIPLDSWFSGPLSGRSLCSEAFAGYFELTRSCWSRFEIISVSTMRVSTDTKQFEL